MGLFGPPDIEKLYKYKHYGGLIKALKHKDPNIVNKAEGALRKLAKDKDAIEERKKIWVISNYDNWLEVLEQLVEKEPARKSAIGPFIQALRDEQKSIKEFKKQFESFFGEGGTNDNFFTALKNILGNEKIEYAKRWYGRYALSAYSGFIITKERVLYFDLGLAPTFTSVRYDETISFDGYKIKSIHGDELKISRGIGESENEFKNIASYIETRFSERVEPLIQALKDEDYSVRVNAARALGNIKNPKAIQTLIQILKDDEEVSVRQATAWALGDIGDARAIKALIQAKKDKNWFVHDAAKMALEKIEKSQKKKPTLKCKNCGFQNKEDSMFCENCGAKLE